VRIVARVPIHDYIHGTFHHISSHHLERYTTEFDFRYNNRESVGVNGVERTDKLLKGISGKRLMYNQSR